jgi:hypothetical protein
LIQKNNLKKLAMSKSNSKTISIKINATQFQKGDTSFMGTDVRNLKTKKDEKTGKHVVVDHEPGVDEEPFALVTINGSHTRVEQGQWVVELPGGRQEIWTDEQVKAAGKETDVADARLGDEEIKAQLRDKEVADYKEHNPKANAGNAPETGKAESKGKKEEPKK